MTVASAIETKQQQIAAAYTACDGKGATMPQAQNLTNLADCIDSISAGSSPVITSLSITPTTSAQTITAPSGTDGYSPISVAAVTSSIDSNISAENIKKDVQILGVTGTYEGSGGGGGGKYQLLQRISDDGDNEIGTVSGFFTDSNNVEYAVVCLDAQYRNSTMKWSNALGAVTNLPTITGWDVWANNPMTAKENCDIIAVGTTSPAVSYCRGKSFTIDGVTYYGQLPNILELVDIAKNYININTKDTSQDRTYILPWGAGNAISSTQGGPNYCWSIQSTGNCSVHYKTNVGFTIPVLELPNS